MSLMIKEPRYVGLNVFSLCIEEICQGLSQVHSSDGRVDHPLRSVELGLPVRNIPRNHRLRT